MPARRRQSRSSRSSRGRSTQRRPVSRKRITHIQHDTPPPEPTRLSQMRLTELQGIADSHGIAFAGMDKARLVAELRRVL